MNKYFLYAFALAALTFTACSDDDDDKDDPGVVTPSTSDDDDDDDDDDDPGVVPLGTSAVVLNTGNWGRSDASIMRYYLTNDSITADLYYLANSENLGDLGQDIIKYGSKYYVTVGTPSKVVVLDGNMSVIKSIPFENDSSEATTPRYMAAANGKVYVTAYDNTVTRIDTISLARTGKVEVGDHPEGISYANGKLYVNNSGYGTGNTVSVIDEASFTKTKDIEVVVNPYTESVVAADGNVYIVSSGNYSDIYATVQRINTVTDEVDSICNGSYIATYGNNLYVLYSEYYSPERSKAFVYDLKTGTETTLTDISQFSSPGGIDVDPTTGFIYIYDTPYGSNGKICGPILSDGTPSHTVEAGPFTSKMIFE